LVADHPDSFIGLLRSRGFAMTALAPTPLREPTSSEARCFEMSPGVPGQHFSPRCGSRTWRADHFRRSSEESSHRTGRTAVQVTGRSVSVRLVGDARVSCVAGQGMGRHNEVIAPVFRLHFLLECALRDDVPHTIRPRLLIHSWSDSIYADARTITARQKNCRTRKLRNVLTERRRGGVGELRRHVSRVTTTKYNLSTANIGAFTPGAGCLCFAAWAITIRSPPRHCARGQNRSNYGHTNACAAWPGATPRAFLASNARGWLDTAETANAAHLRTFGLPYGTPCPSPAWSTPPPFTMIDTMRSTGPPERHPRHSGTRDGLRPFPWRRAGRRLKLPNCPRSNAGPSCFPGSSCRERRHCSCTHPGAGWSR